MTQTSAHLVWKEAPLHKVLQGENKKKRQLGLTETFYPTKL